MTELVQLRRLEKLISERPYSIGLIKKALALLPDCEHTAWLTDLMRREGRPLDAAIKVLGQKIGHDAVEETLTETLKAATNQEPYLSIGRLQDCFLSFREPRAGDIATALAWPGALAFETFSRYLLPRAREVEFAWRTKESAYEPLAEDHGRQIGQAAAEAELLPQLPALQSFLEGKFPPCPEWELKLSSVHARSPQEKEFIFRAEREVTLADQIVARGTLDFPDPLTGDLVQCRDSFFLFSRTVYLFRGKEFFILITGTAFNVPILLYLPKRSLIVRLSTIARSVQKSVELMPLTMAHILHRHARLALEKPKASQTRLGPVLVVNAIGNPAHHLWNFLTAIERLRVCGMTSRLSRVLYGGTEFFGPLDEVFPELKGLCEAPRNHNLIDPSPGDPERLVVGTGGFFIPKSLSERLVDLMRTRARESSAIAEPGDFVTGEAGHVVWLGLRVGDKMWVGQEDGIPFIIDHLAAQFPGSVFVLDGYSFPIGRDMVSERWRRSIDQLYDLGERIKKSCSDPARVVNAVGNSFREAILWADACSVYLVPFGSAQHKVAWFTAAPGVVYVGPDFPVEFVRKSPGNLAAEISGPVTWIYGARAESSEQSRTSRLNVRLDAQELVFELATYLNRLSAELEGAAPTPASDRESRIRE